VYGIEVVHKTPRTESVSAVEIVMLDGIFLYNNYCNNNVIIRHMVLPGCDVCVFFLIIICSLCDSVIPAVIKITLK